MNDRDGQELAGEIKEASRVKLNFFLEKARRVYQQGYINFLIRRWAKYICTEVFWCIFRNYQRR